MRLDPLAEEPAEHVGPGVVRRHPQARRLRLAGKAGPHPARRRRQAVIEIDAGMAEEGVADADPLGRLERVRPAAAKGEGLGARNLGGERKQRGAIVHQRRQRRADAIPFQHREFRRMQRRALAVAEDMGQREDPRLAGGRELLHREFGRRVKPGLARRAVGADEAGAKPVQVGLVARAKPAGRPDRPRRSLWRRTIAEPPRRCGRVRRAAAGGRRGGRGSRTARARTNSKSSEACGRIAERSIWPLPPKSV